jgi:hypothetical protein
MPKEIENQTEKPRKGINWTTDKIMSTSALFISVISLIALLYQSYLAREENKLTQKQQSASVLPYLNSWYSNSSEGFKMIFGNKGVGPAFIKNVEIKFNDTLNFNNTDQLFQYVFKTAEGLDSIPYSNSTFTKGYVLPANETIEVIVVENRNGIKLFKDYMNDNKLDYTILYEDVYGEKWTLKYSNGFSIPQPLEKQEE